jgi:uncharacterized protein YegL
MKKGYTHLVIVLDKSGSMSDCWEKTIKGMKDFLKENDIDGLKTTFSLYTFDNHVNTLSSFRDIKNTDLPNIIPNGGTALYDAFGVSCENEGTLLASMKEQDRPEKVIVFTLTDGGENASNKYLLNNVKDIISHQENNYKWKFVFFGADFNINAVSSNIGMAKSYSRNIGKADMLESLNSLGTSFKSYRQSGYDDKKLEASLDSIGD